MPAIYLKNRILISRWMRLGLLLLFLVAIYFLLDGSGALVIILDGEQLTDYLAQLGLAGPLVIIGIMAIAIIINPIPSAPIAMAAGALYGHTWGTVYVVAGAAGGAIGAFWIARLAGYELLRQFIGSGIRLKWKGTQNTLMVMVFISRLVPFLSFDLVSYGAGLTPLKTWRFALATVAGLIPASFLLTHLGGELSSANLEQALQASLLVGGIIVIPIIIIAIAKKRQHREIL